jgi:hypothetical protein
MNDKLEKKIKIPLSIYLESFFDLWLHLQVRKKTIWNFVYKDKIGRIKGRNKDEKKDKVREDKKEKITKVHNNDNELRAKVRKEQGMKEICSNFFYIFPFRERHR